MQAKRVLAQAAGAALLIGLIGCSNAATNEGAATPAASTSGSATAAATAAPKAVTLDSTFGTGGIATVPLAASHNRFMAVATAPDGKVYAAGFVAEGGDQALAVARLDAKGALDKSFGKDGVASANVAIGGKVVELARAVVVQSTGKIVIAGPVEHDTAATGDAAKDTDVALVRFDATGKIDTTFGKSGVSIIDFGSGAATPAPAAGGAAGFVGDTSWGLGNLAGDKLVVFGSKRNEAQGRTDTDYVIAGMTDAGLLDSTFGTAGKVIVDNGGVDNPRNLLVQPDGKVVATGYSTIAGVVQPVLIRVDAKGVLDKAFGKDGVATEKVLAGVTESYNVSLQGSDYILAGYGRGADATEKVDLVVYRFKADGKFDTTFGGGTGATRLDIAKDDDRARNVAVLPDGGILAVGSGKKTATNIDGMLVLMSKDGELVKSFGDGGNLISDLGGPADAWYGVTVSSDKKSVIVVGYKGTDATSGGVDTAMAARLTL